TFIVKEINTGSFWLCSSFGSLELLIKSNECAGVNNILPTTNSTAIIFFSIIIFFFVPIFLYMTEYHKIYATQSQFSLHPRYTAQSRKDEIFNHPSFLCVSLSQTRPHRESCNEGK